jgi:hypothetical protein
MLLLGTVIAYYEIKFRRLQASLAVCRRLQGGLAVEETTGPCVGAV